MRPSATRYERASTLGPAAKAEGTNERTAAIRSSLSFTGAKCTRASERPAYDEHRSGHEQQECDRQRIAPGLRPPVEVPHQPEAVQTSLFSLAASAAAAERQSSSAVRKA